MDSLTKKLVAGWLLTALTEENDLNEVKQDIKHAIKLLLDLNI